MILENDFSIFFVFWKILISFVENIYFPHHRIMENKIIKLSDAPKYPANPFVESAQKEIESKMVIKQIYGSRADQKAVVASVDTNTGETFDVSFARRIEVDEDQFAKIYVREVGKINTLTNAGIRVLSYILKHIKPNTAELLINREACLQEIGYKTPKPLYRGLAELVAASIIARGWTDNLYFINPLVIFNGNRAVFATEYIRKRDADKKAKGELKTQKQIMDEHSNIKEFQGQAPKTAPESQSTEPPTPEEDPRQMSLFPD